MMNTTKVWPNTTTVSLSTATVSPEDESVRRWRQWQAHYAASSRRTTQIARVVFGVAFTATAVWLGVQLMR